MAETHFVFLKVNTFSKQSIYLRFIKKIFLQQNITQFQSNQEQASFKTNEINFVMKSEK